MKLLFLILLYTSTSLFANEPELTTKSRIAKKLYIESLDFMNRKDFETVIFNNKKAVDNDPRFIEAWLILAEAYYGQTNYDAAIECYQKAIDIDPNFFPQAFYYRADLLLKMGQYAEALSNIESALTIPKLSQWMKQDANRIKANSLFGIEALKKPVSFNPINLGQGINSRLDEYWPSISVDNQLLVVTRLVPKNPNNPVSRSNGQEDLYISKYNEGIWGKATELGAPLNTFDNEGTQTLSPDGNYMFFTACNRPQGMGGCDIYFSQRDNDTWSEPFNLGSPVNTKYKETQPSMASDGRTLYFVSARTDGKGGLDIWMSHLRDDATWSAPENLGDSINTPYDEQSPFIHPDNQTLYFSSNGWPGMGRQDIFLSRRIDEKTWAKPLNIGYPINTFKEETGLVVDSKGEKAYYSSDRDLQNGKDIYSFDLPQEARPLLTTYMKGFVYNEETRAPLDARFELIDLKNKVTISRAKSGKKTGNFLLCIPANREYALNVSKKGFLFYSQHFTLTSVNDKTEPFLVDVGLQPLKTGSKSILNNIFFETKSAELKPESIVELDKLLQFLNDNDMLKIEIGGHTDNVGEKTFNQKLSEKRAQSVVNYLVEKGINIQRLTYKGYGETEPQSDNSTETGRAQNRRTEFKIISN